MGRGTLNLGHIKSGSLFRHLSGKVDEAESGVQ